MNKTYVVLKNLLLSCAILLSFSATAQNYECVQPGVKHYFTNSAGYLRGVRIDSVKTFADSTVLYPYHTARGRHYWSTGTVDTTGGSWLGKVVTELNDGTFLFDNLFGDTVVIKTRAHTGDQWILYSDTTKLYYQAEVTGEDTMTVLGAIDSVKKILITARDPSGIVTTDLADSLELILGKHSGFVRAIDLYTFPYHAPDSTYNLRAVDYFLDNVLSKDPANKTNLVFSLTPFSWPMQTDIYNWNVGDAYELKYCVSTYTEDCVNPQKYEFDSIGGKTVYADSIRYDLVGWAATQQYKPWAYTPDASYPYSRSPISYPYTVLNKPFFDTTFMPEENGAQLLLYYFPGDASNCHTSDKYYTTPSYIHGNSVRTFIESGGPNYTYKKDLALVYRSYYSSGGTIPEEVDAVKMLWYSRTGTPCGSFVGPEALDVPTIAGEDDAITLSPNPATGDITVSATRNMNAIELYNYTGQSLFSFPSHDKITHIDISTLPPGVYLVRVNGTMTRKFVKE